MIVNCKSYKYGPVIQQDAFVFIQPRPLKAIEDRENFRKPSVQLIGIDSMSRMNIRRVMPKTFDFITENNWFELQGYMKVSTIYK